MVKKGFFFSLMSLFFLILFFIVMQTVFIQEDSQNYGAFRTQSTQFSSFVDTFETFHLPKISQVAFESAIHHSINNISKKELVFTESDFQSQMYSLIYNGTVNDKYIHNVTIQNLLANLTQISESFYNINLSVTVYDEYFYVNHTESAWRITLQVLYTYSVDDGFIFWQNKTVLTTSSILITQFDDPLRAYQNISTIPIQRSNIQPSQWNISLFSDFIQNQKFALSDLGPSFLDRLRNKTQPSNFGIESFILPSNVTFFDDLQNRSYVDYQFFGLWNCTDDELFNISTLTNGDFENFRIPENIFIRYTNESAHEFGTFSSQVCP